MKRKATVKVYKLVIFSVAFLFVAIIAKLCYVALSDKVDGIDLTKFANSRNTVRKTLYAPRGSILDIHGNDLASTVNSYTLIAYLEPSRTTDPDDPQHVVDKKTTAKKLAKVLKAPEEKMLEYLNKENVYQVEFGTYGRGLSELKKNEIEKLGLPGIDFMVSSTRYYKMGDFASYIIGYAKNNEEGKIKGEMGIESYFDKELTGTDGYTEYQQDAYGYQMPNTPYNIKEPISGSDVYLTIDNNIQIICDNAIKDLDKNYDFEWMIFDVMDAKTGAIVASSSYPSFNVNDLNTLTNYLNPLTAYQYEPGSTMKIYSFMASMENNQYDGNKTFKSGSIEVADATIRDFNNIGWGEISYDVGFAYSSNVGATKLALNLGKDKLKAFYQKMGFGKQTGIELPGEVSGKIAFNYQTELANASFGQGILTTPIQNLQALTVLTNNGHMIKPYLVDRIVDSQGNVTYKAEKTDLGEKVSKKTINKMNKLMYDVVYNGLSTGWQADNVVLVGKTGTAQIASHRGGYLSGPFDYVRSFAGYFPYDDPKYIIYSSVKTINSDKNVMAEVIKRAVEEIAKYSNITTTNNDVDESKIVTVGNYLNSNVDDVKQELTKKKLNPIVIGKGKKVVNQYPLNGITKSMGSRVFLLTNDDNYTLPNLTNYSASEVVNLCNLLKINYTLEGYGRVKSYSKPAGTKISSIDNLKIKLSTK